MIFMLDTNAISDLLHGQPQLSLRVRKTSIASLVMSSITEGELLYGLAKRPQATKLRVAVHELLLRIESLPWRHAEAKVYGNIRADLERQGTSLGALDCLIAAHALATGATLITRDKAFTKVPHLITEDWTQ